jgi:hypothetical protein
VGVHSMAVMATVGDSVQVASCHVSVGSSASGGGGCCDGTATLAADGTESAGGAADCPSHDGPVTVQTTSANGWMCCEGSQSPSPRPKTPSPKHTLTRTHICSES